MANIERPWPDSSPDSSPGPPRRAVQATKSSSSTSRLEQPRKVVLDQATCQRRVAAAHKRVATELAAPFAHGRCCIFGLAVLELIRVSAWLQGEIPGYSVFGMHFLTTITDLSCLLCTLPVFMLGAQGQCVQLGCLGPMLTLVFAMALVDMSALAAYLVVATPRPLAPGAKSFVDELEATLGVWEFALVASVALQAALLASSWRVYRQLRMAGLYPPGLDVSSLDKTHTVSILEVMCEAEDLELLTECRFPCDGEFKRTVLPGEVMVNEGSPTLFVEVPAVRGHAAGAAQAPWQAACLPPASFSP